MMEERQDVNHAVLERLNREVARAKGLELELREQIILMDRKNEIIESMHSSFVDMSEFIVSKNLSREYTAYLVAIRMEKS